MAQKIHVPLAVAACLMVAAGFFAFGTQALLEAAASSGGSFDPRQATFAEWVTALFSGLSVLVAAWATMLLRSTLEQSRIATTAAVDATLTTRSIGQAQTRAYLVVEEGSFQITGTGAVYCIKVRNVGMTPALGVHARIWINVQRSSWQYEPLPARAAAVASTETVTLHLWINNASNPGATVSGNMSKFPEIPGDQFDLLQNGEDGIHWLDFAAGWDDVFGNRQILSGGLSIKTIAKTENEGRMGTLHFRGATGRMERAPS